MLILQIYSRSPNNTASSDATVLKKNYESKIAIIGAGIIGMTTAYHLLKTGYRHVAVLSKDAPLSTNSDVAAALWRPYDANPLEKALATNREKNPGFPFKLMLSILVLSLKKSRSGC